MIQRPKRLSRIAAMIVAVAALALCFERADDRLGLQFGKHTAVSPAEAVDISLQRLGRWRLRGQVTEGEPPERLAQEEPGDR